MRRVRALPFFFFLGVCGVESGLKFEVKLAESKSKFKVKLVESLGECGVESGGVIYPWGMPWVATSSQTVSSCLLLRHSNMYVCTYYVCMYVAQLKLLFILLALVSQGTTLQHGKCPEWIMRNQRWVSGLKLSGQVFSEQWTAFPLLHISVQLSNPLLTLPSMQCCVCAHRVHYITERHQHSLGEMLT